MPLIIASTHSKCSWICRHSAHVLFTSSKTTMKFNPCTRKYYFAISLVLWHIMSMCASLFVLDTYVQPIALSLLKMKAHIFHSQRKSGSNPFLEMVICAWFESIRENTWFFHYFLRGFFTQKTNIHLLYSCLKVHTCWGIVITFFVIRFIFSQAPSFTLRKPHFYWCYTWCL